MTSRDDRYFSTQRFYQMIEHFEHEWDLSELATFLVKIDREKKRVYRKRGGVRFPENERPMRLLGFYRNILAFKVPASQSSHRGGKYYYNPRVLVCLVLTEPDKDGWSSAYEFIEWDHVQGAYADPKEER